jgi:hypothetical protein
MFKQLRPFASEFRVMLACALLFVTLLLWGTGYDGPRFWWLVPVTGSVVLFAKPLFKRARPRKREPRPDYGRVVVTTREPAASAHEQSWAEEASLSRQDEEPPPTRLQPAGNRDWRPADELLRYSDNRV